MAEIIAEKICQETFIKASPEKVYDTITSGEGWNAFFTAETSVKAIPGGTITFRWKDWGPNFYTHSAGGPVLEADRGKKFSFKWGTENPSIVTFELTGKFGGTVVKVTEEGYPNTSQGRASMLSCASGWGEAVTLLKFYLEHGIVYTQPQE